MGNPIGMNYDELVRDKAERVHLLDDNHCFTWIYGAADHYEVPPTSYWPRRDDTVLVGIIEYHRTPDNQACGGIVSFLHEEHDHRHPGQPIDHPERPVWKVISLDPLTITPSVLCPDKFGCGGTHGFIVDGKWQQT